MFVFLSSHGFASNSCSSVLALSSLWDVNLWRSWSPIAVAPGASDAFSCGHCDATVSPHEIRRLGRTRADHPTVTVLEVQATCSQEKELFSAQFFPMCIGNVSRLCRKFIAHPSQFEVIAAVLGFELYLRKARNHSIGFCVCWMPELYLELLRNGDHQFPIISAVRGALQLFNWQATWFCDGNILRPSFILWIFLSENLSGHGDLVIGRLIDLFFPHGLLFNFWLVTSWRFFVTPGTSLTTTSGILWTHLPGHVFATRASGPDVRWNCARFWERTSPPQSSSGVRLLPSVANIRGQPSLLPNQSSIWPCRCLCI